MKSLLLKIWAVIVPILKAEAVKLALVKILGTAAAGGFRAWIIKKIVTHFYDEVAKKVAEYGGYIYYKIDGKIQFKRLQEAKEDNDQDKYDDTIDNILS